MMYCRGVFLSLVGSAVLALSSVVHAETGDALDRSNLTATFADEFEAFRWYEESADGKKEGGVWRTNFGYRWVALDDVKNHTLVWNKEEQLYVDPAFRGTGDAALGLKTIEAKNGVLHITARRAPENPALSGYRYLSGLITSEPSFTQTYGLFEMRAKLPKGKGLWPAFWLLPADKSWPPEIDVMEMLGHEPTKFYTTLHSKASGVKTKSAIPAHHVTDLSAAFHTYAVEWGPKEIIFYFDDREIAREPTPDDMHKPFYLLANLAIGGSWPGSPDATTRFPAVMEIDWIRVWKREE